MGRPSSPVHLLTWKYDLPFLYRQCDLERTWLRVFSFKNLTMNSLFSTLFVSHFLFLKESDIVLRDFMTSSTSVSPYLRVMTHVVFAKSVYLFITSLVYGIYTWDSFGAEPVWLLVAEVVLLRLSSQSCGPLADLCHLYSLSPPPISFLVESKLLVLAFSSGSKGTLVHGDPDRYSRSKPLWGNLRLVSSETTSITPLGFRVWFPLPHLLLYCLCYL